MQKKLNANKPDANKLDANKRATPAKIDKGLNHKFDGGWSTILIPNLTLKPFHDAVLS